MSVPKRKKKVTLVGKFAFIIGISVAFSVFVVSIYNIYAGESILEQYKANKANEFNSIGDMVYGRFQKNYFEEANYVTFRSFIDDLVTNRLVLHVGLINKNTGIYEWSSIPEMEGSKTLYLHPLDNKQFIKVYGQIKRDDIYLKIYNTEDSTIVVSFYMNSAMTQLVQILKNGNFWLALTFIIFGFLSAFILARQVTKPVEALVIGVSEFSKGNLDYRTNVKSNDELGILAKAFNYMAEKLNDLYTSLEKKVQERTKELSYKNEELNKAYAEIKDAQAMMVHNEKMRSLGELVAGVAHELNNPINFIYGNMTHLKEYSKNLIEIISKYEALREEDNPEKYKEIDDYKEEIDYEFLEEDITDLIQSCIEGSERSKQIILDLKDFSRLDQSQVKGIDINESIDSTLNILKNKYKDKVNVVKKYGELPEFECYAGQMNQVFMNILDNAAQAVEQGGNVTITTKIENDKLVIEFEDDGPGIEKDVLNQIFDPFFTTKPVGSGTGLGLSISFKIIKNHCGIIIAESEVGKGTKFIITIPLNWKELSKGEEPENKEETQETTETETNDESSDDVEKEEKSEEVAENA